jgi:D-threitol dehydrogenase (NAD+)
VSGDAARVVVVTGGASPLGAELGRRFGAARDRVVRADWTAAPGVVPLAPGDPAAYRALVERVVREHGRIDVWVNHHPFERLSPAAELSLEGWEECLGRITTATFVGAQAAGRAMLAQGHGVIVNVAGVDAFHASAGGAATGVAQAAVVKLTEALGVEWAPRGVRVVGVAVGPITDGPPREPLRPSRIPLARPASVAEAAEAVVYLAGPEASYVVGETLRVDGGWSAYQLF